jgi:hypothetical protein
LTPLYTYKALREMADEKLGTLFGLLPDTEDSEQGEDLFAQLVRIVSAPPIEPTVTVTNHDGFEELQEVLTLTKMKLEAAVAKVGAAKKEKAGADKAVKERKAAAMMAQRKATASEKEARLNEESLRSKVRLCLCVYIGCTPTSLSHFIGARAGGAEYCA